MLVILDYGGTLIRMKRSEEDVLRDTLKELSNRWNVDVELLEKSYREIFDSYNRRRNEYHAEVFSRTLRRAFLRRVVDVTEDDIRRAHSLLVKKRQEATEPFEDVRETLEELKSQGYKLALLSNATYHDAVIGSLDYHDLLKYIDYPYTSASLGVRKPHPRSFILAARLSGFEPKDAVMVGNDPYKDYLGAVNAGLRAVLIDRSGESKANVKNVINDLRRLPEILSSRF